MSGRKQGCCFAPANVRLFGVNKKKKRSYFTQQAFLPCVNSTSFGRCAVMYGGVGVLIAWKPSSDSLEVGSLSLGSKCWKYAVAAACLATSAGGEKRISAQALPPLSSGSRSLFVVEPEPIEVGHATHPFFCFRKIEEGETVGCPGIA